MSNDMNVFTRWHYGKWYYPMTILTNIKDFKRRLIDAYERIVYGIARRDTYNLDYHICYVIINGLRMLAKYHHTHPNDIDDKHWTKYLYETADLIEEGITGLQRCPYNYSEDPENYNKFINEANKKLKQGLQYVVNDIDSLWD